MPAKAGIHDFISTFTGRAASPQGFIRGFHRLTQIKPRSFCVNL